MSYRRRGKQHRTQINIKQTKKVFNKDNDNPRKNKLDTNLRNMIIPYSIIKINANNPPPYSILNPETISDSPSAKSKGVRLLSAMHIIIQQKNKGIDKKQNHMFSCINFNFIIEYEFIK